MPDRVGVIPNFSNGGVRWLGEKNSASPRVFVGLVELPSWVRETWIKLYVVCP